MTSLTSVLVLFSVFTASLALLPFGTKRGDEHIAADSSGHIKLPCEVYVDGNHYEGCKVYPSGHIDLLLLDSLGQHQQANARVEVWKSSADIEPTDVYARLARDQDLELVTPIVQNALGSVLAANRVLIATWIYKIKEVDGSPTSQCVIVTDENRSHVIFLDNQDSATDGTCARDQSTSCTSQKAVKLIPLVRKPVTVEAYRVFQLRYNGRCLCLSSTKGYYAKCLTSDGDPEDLTLYEISGTPGKQQFYVLGTGQCLDRESCHHSKSNLRRSSCSHCGAKNWEYWKNGQLTEDDGSNCIYDSGSWTAAVRHTSDGGCTQFTRYYPSTSTSYNEFPNPDISLFTDSLPTALLKGLRVYQDDGKASFEVVHALPPEVSFPIITKRGVYQIEYWVVDIKTKVPYTDTLVPGMIINWLDSNQEVVTSVDLRYGAVDFDGGQFGETDGVLSIFVKNEYPGAIKVPVDKALLRMLVFRENGDEWWLTAPRFHFGEYRQAYYSFVGKSPIYPGLYWTRQYEE